MSLNESYGTDMWVQPCDLVVIESWGEGLSSPSGLLALKYYPWLAKEHEMLTRKFGIVPMCFRTQEGPIFTFPTRWSKNGMPDIGKIRSSAERLKILTDMEGWTDVCLPLKIGTSQQTAWESVAKALEEVLDDNRFTFCSEEAAPGKVDDKEAGGLERCPKADTKADTSVRLQRGDGEPPEEVTVKVNGKEIVVKLNKVSDEEADHKAEIKAEG